MISLVFIAFKHDNSSLTYIHANIPNYSTYINNHQYISLHIVYLSNLLN